MHDEDSPTPSMELQAQFGAIDIYLFDQVLKGSFDDRRRILEAGCGGGRNLVYFLRRRFEVFAIDDDPAAVSAVRAAAARLAPDLPPSNIQVGRIEALPWDEGSMDAVICSAVLHFVADEQQFASMLQDMWRVLSKGGLFFARLATSIGLEASLPATRGRVRLPDGTDRFVVDERTLLDWTRRLGAVQIEPIKTTNVQNMRCMTTWCLEKP